MPGGSVAALDTAGYVALTYDDGPDPGSTTDLLAALRAVGARATFFNIGAHQRRAPELVRAQLTAGMWIGNHSWSHPRLTALDRAAVADELTRTQVLTRRLTGHPPVLFRPPYGETNAEVRHVAAGLGMAEVLWTVDTEDWNGASTADIVAAAATLEPGGVLLMHDGGYRTTVDAVGPVVRVLADRGLRPGMISARTCTVIPAPAGG
jgi:peptidoglycan/xylan/chitin deacetylase (PgdA/CDA1 family)